MTKQFKGRESNSTETRSLKKQLPESLEGVKSTYAMQQIGLIACSVSFKG